MKFVFFGTDDFSVAVLEELKISGYMPEIVVCAPDRRVGRGLILTAPPSKKWAELNKIKTLQPEKLDNEFSENLRNEKYDIFIVASYGKIIPKEIIDMPSKGTLNVHPSLLPKYRGSSPVESQILDDEQEVGVSIMLIDEKMDHGPIISQTHYDTEHNEKMKSGDLSIELARRGGALLSKIIPDWLSGKIEAKEQDHSKATFTKKIQKEDGLISLEDNGYKNYLKYLAYDTWPGIYFFTNKNGKQIRLKITNAEFVLGEFRVLKVIPEGGREMSYDDFLLGSGGTR